MNCSGISPGTESAKGRGNELEVESRQAIEKAARALLRRADALGRLPTPVDDIVTAAKLVEPSESMLSAHVIADAPAHIRAAMRRIAGRVRGLLDRRALEVHLDPTITHQPRRNFVVLHETVHHILPWQVELAYADDDRTLASGPNELFELEASQGAADLLFQLGGFTDDAADLAIGMGGVILTAQRYGASIRASLRRYVETHRAGVASVVLEPSPELGEPLRYRRHEFTSSRRYQASFGAEIWPSRLRLDRYPFIAEAAAAFSAPHQIVCGEWRRTDLSGANVSLRVETLWTGYDLLVLLWVPVAERTKRRVRLTS
jgi:hypothetical protein